MKRTYIETGKRQSEVIIIGWIDIGKPADNGETMKNQLMIQRLEELGIKCRQMDFKNWKHHPWIFLKLAWNLLAHRDNAIIFSTSAKNIYFMMKMMYKLKWKQHTIHWVIGGSFGMHVQNGTYAPNIIGYMDWTIVESPVMVEQLEALGVKGVMQLPNFKPINYYPDIQPRTQSLAQRPIRFVFLSRIATEKGCDYIMECAKQLNEMGYQEKYSIDFYGSIGKTYEKTFMGKIQHLDNVHYRGFLNLREPSGYDRLAEYDMMLFPTYWKSEGFAGVFIDAFISGVPLLASEWAHNREFLKENETALFVPVHNIPALRKKMKECIEGKYDLREMALCCQKEAINYDINHVITRDLVKKIGLIS